MLIIEKHFTTLFKLLSFKITEIVYHKRKLR